MRDIYSLASIRAAERRALAAQGTSDHLMRQAAAHIADVAERLLADTAAETATVLLLVGPGGNGGDALYAGALLRQRGYTVAAWFSDPSCHEPALSELRAKGGIRCDTLAGQRPALIIDGIAGLGAGRPITAELAEFLHSDRHDSRSCVLAIDIPTGIDYDTGGIPEPIDTGAARLPAHVIADETITFHAGGAAHALSPWCGTVIVREVYDAGGQSISDHLRLQPVAAYLPPLTHMPSAACEPGCADNKYSGGVVGICAGSTQYPGAAVLAVGSAVRATAAMVRFIGDAELAGRVIAADPEVVAHTGIDTAGRCDAWVVGPGWGTSAERAEELSRILESPEPVVLDADALTLLASHDVLRQAVRRRQHRNHSTLLTPHAGEFRRLAEAVRLPEDPADLLRSVPALARELGAIVLHKGWATVCANGSVSARLSDSTGELPLVWHARSSWAATPGTGDILAGIAGAYAAHAWKCSSASGQPAVGAISANATRAGGADIGTVFASVLDAVRVHDAAVWYACHSDGPGARPTSATEIMAHIRPATAALGSNNARDSNARANASIADSGSDIRRSDTAPRPIAVITGASRGIGHAIARELHNTHELILVSSRPNPELQQDFPEAHCLAADFNDGAQAVELLAQKIEAFVAERGRGVDVLVHNAGVTGHDLLAETTLEQWHKTFNVNVFAVAELTRVLVPQLEQARATVVFINSGAGLRAAGKGYGSYAASKFALTGYADALREEHRGAFRVTSIHPGKTDSDMQRHIQALRGIRGDNYDATQFMKPESVAAAVRAAIDATPDASIDAITVRPAAG